MSELQNPYQIAFDVYHCQKDVIKLSQFNIVVHIESFTESALSLFGNVEKYQRLIGQTLPVKFFKGNTYYCDTEDKEILLMDQTYNLSFSNAQYNNINMQQFMQAIQVADLTKEYLAVSDSLVYGYTKHNANNSTLFFDTVKAWIQYNPSSMIYLNDDMRSQFPLEASNPEIVNEFKEFATMHLKQSVNHMKVLNDYCADWQKLLDFTNTKINNLDSSHNKATKALIKKDTIDADTSHKFEPLDWAGIKAAKTKIKMK